MTILITSSKFWSFKLENFDLHAENYATYMKILLMEYWFYSHKLVMGMNSNSSRELQTFKPPNLWGGLHVIFNFLVLNIYRTVFQNATLWALQETNILYYNVKSQVLMWYLRVDSYFLSWLCSMNHMINTITYGRTFLPNTKLF